MADWTKDMQGICEKLTEEISEMNKKMDKNGGKMSAGDLEALDKLTHALKSVKTTLAMEEYDDERSGDYRGSYERGGNRGGGSYRGGSYEQGGSYARGRGRYAKRDSMGRYSSEYGYSRDEAVDDMAEDIRAAMPTMPEPLRKEAERFLMKLEQM
ncbi:MAG: hypothetical protein IJH64_00630 [Oscillospiraceae bacterium]|nr:hypothetical protein [Oscillospiraceae bacterium]